MIASLCSQMKTEMKIRQIFRLIIIGMVMKRADCADLNTTLRTAVNQGASTEPFDIDYSTALADIKNYHTNRWLSKLINMPMYEGDMIICCRDFSYSIFGRVHTLTLTVYDGLITDEDTGRQLMITGYPDQTTAKKALQRAMVHYMTLLGKMHETEVEPDGRGSYTQWEVQPAIPSLAQLNTNENYKMNVRDKGLIYILNNKTFTLPCNKKLERKGSEIDVENVRHVFAQIGYKAIIYENLTAQGIRKSLETLKGKVDSSHPSVVLMFMSHGDEKGILGVDLCHITIREIKDAFTGQKCPVLIGKPKIIFVQACRGDKTIKNVLESDWSPESRQCLSKVEPKSKLENDGPEPANLELTTRNIEHVEPDAPEADIAHYYIAQSTTEGHFSLRSRVEGSCFIQALCEELIKRAHQDTLDTIMGLVTRRVQGRVWQFNGLKTLQVPQIIKQGIDKDIYLLPKYPN